VVRIAVSEEVEGNLIGGMNPARLKVTSMAGTFTHHHTIGHPSMARVGWIIWIIRVQDPLCS
jgi:hypothetical protein